MRNPKGTGSIRKRADGRYEYRAVVDGQKVYAYARTAAELNKKIKAIKLTTRSTVDEAYTGWLAKVKKERAAATYEQYYYMYKAHIKPVIGSKKAAAVTQTDIDKIISGMDGLAQSTKNHVKKVLRLCFTAIGLPEIVQSIVIPKTDGSRRKVLTADEVEKLLTAMQGSRWLPSVEFCLESAVRVGELLALTYDDIKDGEIHITKSLSGQTKSRKSRTVPITNKLSDIIARQKQMLEDEYNPILYRPGMTKYLFPKQNGEQMNRRMYAKTIQRYAEKAGVDATPHSLRHTFVFQNRDKLTIKELQSILGHEKSTSTLDLYGDMVDNNAIAAKLNGKFDEATKKLILEIVGQIVGQTEKG